MEVRAAITIGQLSSQVALLKCCSTKSKRFPSDALSKTRKSFSSSLDLNPLEAKWIVPVSSTWSAVIHRKPRS
jgi:hypothetical protein